MDAITPEPLAGVAPAFIEAAILTLLSPSILKKIMSAPMKSPADALM